MLRLPLNQIPEQVLDDILRDCFQWIGKKVGDRSKQINKLNYRRKKAARKGTSKHNLKLQWSYYRKHLKLGKGSIAEMDFNTNRISIYCSKKFSLEYVLDSLLHEYCHSQQSSKLYMYYVIKEKVDYEDHPLEKEAIDFAAKWLPRYWKERGWKFKTK